MVDNRSGESEIFKDYWCRMESHLRSRYSEGDVLLFNEYSLYLVNTLVEELVEENGDYLAVELGCGRGDSSLFFAKRGWQTVLLDLSEVALDIAEQNFLNQSVSCACVKADLENTPFNESKFDMVMNYGVLEHFKDPTTPLTEMYRILKPGGNLFASVLYTKRMSLQTFVDWLYHIPGTIIKNAIIKHKPTQAWRFVRQYLSLNDELYENDLNMKDYRKIMEEIGLTQIQTIAFVTIPYFRLPFYLERLYIGFIRTCCRIKQRITKRHPFYAIFWGHRQWLLWGKKPA